MTAMESMVRQMMNAADERRRVINRFGAKTDLIIRMRGDGFSYRDIAQAVGVSPATVQSIYKEAMK